MSKRVLALGLDPDFVDLPDPRMTPEVVRAHIDSQLCFNSSPADSADAVQRWV